MRRQLILSLVGSILVLFGILTAGCMKNNEKDYYELVDFKDIVVGESTFQDVIELAPCDAASVTAEGSVLKYPMKNGQWIVVVFFYEDPNVVGDIKITDSP